MSSGLARGILNAIPPSILGWMMIAATLTAMGHLLSRCLA